MHWPLIDFECGPNGGADDFLSGSSGPTAARARTVRIGGRGSIPNEQLHGDGYWCGFGNNPATGQPMTTSEWLDRLTPKATAVVAVEPAPPTAGSTRWPAIPPVRWAFPTIWLGLEEHGRHPDRAVPGRPIHPDNPSETLTYLLYMATGQAPMIPLDDALRPQWLFGQTVHEGCDRAGYYEQGDFGNRVRLTQAHRETGCWGPVVKCNVPKRGGSTASGGVRTSAVSASMHHARFPRTSSCRSWTSHRAASCPPRRRDRTDR